MVRTAAVDRIVERVDGEAVLSGPTMEVIGIVGDVKQSFEAGSKAEFFVPYAQFPDPVLTGMYLNVALIARTSGDPAAIAPAVRAALREIDSSQPLVDVRTMETAMAGTVAQPRLQMLLLIVFAGVAVSLANVIGLVIRQGAMLAAAVIAIGLAGAAVASRAVQSRLFVEAGGFDAVTFAGSAVILALAALLASYVPARRAARVSPVSALSR